MSESLEDKEPITVVDTVPSNTVRYYPDENGLKLNRAATITGGWIDTHVGQQFDLQYYIEVRRPGNSVWNPLLRALGKEFIAGNGALIELNVREHMPENSKLRVRVENEDANGYAYDANMLLDVDYEPYGTIGFKIGQLLGVK